jgi:hypothetical protein
MRETGEPTFVLSDHCWRARLRAHGGARSRGSRAVSTHGLNTQRMSAVQKAWSPHVCATILLQHGPAAVSSAIMVIMVIMVILLNNRAPNCSKVEKKKTSNSRSQPSTISFLTMFDPLRQVVLLVTTVALQFQMPRGTRLLSISAEIQRKAHKNTCVTEAPDATGSGVSGLDPLVRASLLQFSQCGCKVRQPRTCMRTPKTNNWQRVLQQQQQQQNSLHRP